MLTIELVPFGTPAFDETIRLRDAILRQPLGLQFEVKDITKEYEQLHLAAYDQHANLVGCLVLVPQEDGFIKMRQVAIDPNYQRQGIGKKLVIASEEVAKSNGYTEMVLNARDTAIPFYEKLGYKKIGKPFTEVTIKHYKMKKSI